MSITYAEASSRLIGVLALSVFLTGYNLKISPLHHTKPHTWHSLFSFLTVLLIKEPTLLINIPFKNVDPEAMERRSQP
jgi:hypothetical protein